MYRRFQNATQKCRNISRIRFALIIQFWTQIIRSYSAVAAKVSGKSN